MFLVKRFDSESEKWREAIYTPALAVLLVFLLEGSLNCEVSLSVLM
jgi:hypothetical protein